MSDDRVITLRNRAVTVALSLLPSSLSSASPSLMADLPTLPDRDPTGPDPVEFETRFARLEQMLQDLVLRSPVDPPVPVHVSVPDPRPPSPFDDEKGLKIVIRNRRFITLLSVDTYRLRDTTPAIRPGQVSSLSSIAATIRPRLEGSFFSGSPALGVLPFLTQIVRVSNQSHVSEAALMWLLEDFLRSPAKEAFRLQSLETWPSAVHWLLTSYAPETAIEEAVRSLQKTTQRPTEKVRDFGLRVQQEASLLGPLIPLSELKSLFSQGLCDPVRSNFAAGQAPLELADHTPLTTLICRAELLERGSMGVGENRLTVPPRPRFARPVLALPTMDDDYGDTDDDMAVLAIQDTYHRDPTQRGLTCYVCFRTGHAWLDCPCLKQLSAKEREDMAYRRRVYFEKKNPPGSPTTRSRPGWVGPTGIVRPQNSWKRESTPSPQLLPRSENESESPRQ
jgi:hypothetical protein